MNVTSPTKPKRNVKLSGISFQPDVWARLEEEVERQGHRNRSLVVERALRQYFAIQDQIGERQQGQTIVVLSEGVA